jgi:hypothetical protein
MTTTATTTAADPHAKIWAENARIFELRRAMWEWHMDSVGGRARLVKDVAREHGASDREIMRAYLRVSADLRPNPFAYQDLDAYAAAWRDALVKALRAYKAMVEYCLGEVLERRVKESRSYRMWSEFRFGFFTRFALYVIQLLLFSAYACWCIATNASYSEIGEHSDGIVRASFVGGCVAAGIGCYFLTRELLQCCSCVADEGLKEYVEFWNIAQVCSHILELASFAMFVSGGDPTSTRLVATYAVFGLWVSLLYFTKAIKQVSFLLEILTTIPRAA